MGRLWGAVAEVASASSSTKFFKIIDLLCTYGSHRNVQEALIGGRHPQRDLRVVVEYGD
ncbi:hypothetical protein BVI434_1290016 [Burkholderia vietnamiensis]|nr:hypothetical protein BVI434_1290016 [Burkholderia vietnamiensis]